MKFDFSALQPIIARIQGIQVDPRSSTYASQRFLTKELQNKCVARPAADGNRIGYS